MRFHRRNQREVIALVAARRRSRVDEVIE